MTSDNLGLILALLYPRLESSEVGTLLRIGISLLGHTPVSLDNACIVWERMMHTIQVTRLL